MIVVDEGLIGLDANVCRGVPGLRDIELLVVLGIRTISRESRSWSISLSQGSSTMVMLLGWYLTSNSQLLNQSRALTYDVFDLDLMQWPCGLGRTVHLDGSI